jgi:hypothetical protein
LLSNHLVADHPEIKRHLATRIVPGKITMIPYGADRVEDAGLIAPYGLMPGVRDSDCPGRAGEFHSGGGAGLVAETA